MNKIVVHGQDFHGAVTMGNFRESRIEGSQVVDIGRKGYHGVGQGLLQPD